MTSIQSTNLAPTAEKSGVPVRFYFGVSVLHLIPANPIGKRGGVADSEWEKRFLAPLRTDVEDRLSREGFEVAYRKHALVDATRRLYAVDFVASTLYRFPAAQISRPKDGTSGFRVRARPLAGAKSLLGKRLSDALGMDYVVDAVAFEYAASRSFVYEVYLEATLKLDRVISREDVEDVGGVRDAIELFASEVAGVLNGYSFNWSASLKTPARRPKDNVYEFELAGTEYLSVSEDEVSGCLALAGMENLDDSVLAGIKVTGAFDCALADAEAMLRHLFETDEGYFVTELTLYLIDYEEEPFDYSDELL